MGALFALIPIFILILTALILIAIRLIRPRFRYHWLVAALGALLTWPVLLVSRSGVPYVSSLMTWQPEWLSKFTPTLVLDQYSWSYAFSLATLILAVILTDVARKPEGDWNVWVGSLFLCALGISAVMAGNPVTLLFFWTAIDLLELMLLLRQYSESQVREKVIIAFSIRLGSSILLIWAIVYGSTLGEIATFSQIPSQVSLYLLLAAGLRLGVFPIYLPNLWGKQHNRSLGTISHMVAAAAGFILLTRIAVFGVPDSISSYFLIFSTIAALYGAFSWATANNEIEGRPFWIIGMGAFALASAVRNQPFASLAWGELALLSGGLIFLSSARNRYVIGLGMLGFLGLTVLPYTPGWNAVELFTQPYNLFLLLLLVAQSVFAVGYLHFIFQPGDKLEGVERWVWLLYPWGLLLLPIAQFIIAWFEWHLRPSFATLLPGLLICVLIVFWIFFDRELSKRPRWLGASLRVGRALGFIFSFRWIYRAIWSFYFLFGKFVRLVSNILEGDGGVLWALLILVIFIAILSQFRVGIK
jgi:hypothetical protein